jgi:hypothetical protein
VRTTVPSEGGAIFPNTCSPRARGGRPRS